MTTVTGRSDDGPERWMGTAMPVGREAVEYA
jgi:hypothetical protein